MKNEIFENAVYQSPTEVLFIGNPLIEAIPSIGDPLEYAAQLMVIMPYQESDRNLNRMERLNKLPYIKQLHVPCTCDTEIAMNVDRCLRWGYYGRNPMPLSVIQQAITENGIPFDDRLRRVFRSYKQPAYGFPVFGISGVGKTCSVMNVLTLYPQVIVHTNYRGVPFDLHQLVWLKVDCPQDGSTKGLCQRILQEMDRILGSHFSEQHSFNRISKEVLLGDLRSAIDSCSLGILVIDDVQNLCSVRDQVSTELLNFLVSLVNTAEVPIVMVGAPKFTTILQSEFQQAKRVTGEGEVHMDLLKQGSKEWNRYIRALWHYQYTRKKVELTAALSDAFYEETVGNQFLLAILYKLVQDYAIISKTETFDAETVHRTADLRLGLTKQQRKDMREGRDVDLTLYEHLWRAPAIPKEMNPQEQMPKDDPLQSLISNLVTVFGVSMQDARKAARSVAAAFPDEKDPAKLLLYAAELLDKSGIGKDSAKGSDNDS